MGLKPNRGVVLFSCLVFLYISQTCGITLEIVHTDEMHLEKRSENIHTGTIAFGTGDISLGRNLEYERRYIGEETADVGSVNIQAADPHPGLVGGRSSIDDYRAWHRMQPSLLCTNDLMKFSAQGPGCSSLQLDRGGKPLSLTQLPQDCGYSVKRTAVGLVFLASLDGCDIVKQGNSHLLQMLWHSNPVTLSCPVSSSDQVSPVLSTTPAPTTEAPTTEAPATAVKLPPQNQQWMHPLFGGYYHPLMPMQTPPQTTEAPTTKAPTTEAPATAAELLPQDQPQQQWMHPLFRGYYHPLIPVQTPPQTTEAPTTEAPATAAEFPPQNQQWMHPLFGDYYHPLIPVKTLPQTTVAPTTEAPTTEASTTVAPTTEAPTTEAPATAAEFPPQNQQWMHPLFGDYYHPLIPVKTLPQTTVAPTTEASTTVAPTTEAPATAAEFSPQNQQWMHPPFGDDYHPLIPVKTPPQTTVAPTTEAPATAVEFPPQNQQWMHPLFGDYYHPLIPVKTLPQTTVAPTTEASTTVAPTTEAPTTEAPATATEFPPQDQQWMHPLFGGDYHPLMPVKA
ncbi:mucin-1-like isoform X2 [Alosa sapidissima]|uniref:mucin-1-like isoform X2 n=1 Tax=Alosa sapidissima TaxID=34773 RepID=UPI001C088248|nr:mucin-1-like isoform X2 [Alosa sapidissima]